MKNIKYKNRHISIIVEDVFGKIVVLFVNLFIVAIIIQLISQRLYDSLESIMSIVSVILFYAMGVGVIGSFARFIYYGKCRKSMVICIIKDSKILLNNKDTHYSLLSFDTTKVKNKIDEMYATIKNNTGLEVNDYFYRGFINSSHNSRKRYRKLNTVYVINDFSGDLLSNNDTNYEFKSIEALNENNFKECYIEVLESIIQDKSVVGNIKHKDSNIIKQRYSIYLQPL